MKKWNVDTQIILMSIVDSEKLVIFYNIYRVKVY